MPSQDTTYQGPKLTFTSLNSASTGIGSNQQGVVAVIGTAPSGPNVPTTFFSLAQAQAAYGSFLDAQASSTGQVGFNLEPALELMYSQSGKFNNLETVCVRAGATLASYNVLDTAQPTGTAFGLTAKPSYAGINTVTAVVGTAVYNSAIGANTQTVALYDNVLGKQTISETYVGTPQSIIQQINQSSQLCTVAGDKVTGVAGTYTLNNALTGVNATPTDYINAINQLIGTDVDYIVALTDDSGVQNALLAFVQSQASLNKPCQAFLAPAYLGLQPATVVNNALANVGNFNSAQVCYLANSGGVRRNPVTNKNMVYDGFYWAACVAAIKALNNPADPVSNKPIAGLLSLTETFTPTQAVNMGSFGVMCIVTDQSGIHIFDGVTTDNPGNYRRENIRSQENRLIRYIRDACQPLIGTAPAIANSLVIYQTVVAALAKAVTDHVILGFNNASVSVVPNATQPGKYTVAVSYNPRVEIIEIDFELAINFVL